MQSKRTKDETEKCQARHPDNNKPICTRKLWDSNEKLCIFHSREKPTEEFEQHLISEFEQVNENDELKYYDGRGFVFPPKVSLANLTFQKEVNFDLAVFGDSISFWSAKFIKKVSFGYAKFGNRANFAGTRFGDEAHFMHAQFGEHANFNGSRFEEEATFGDAEFGDAVNFGATLFDGYTSFFGTKFGKEAFFAETQFSKEAVFEEAEFGRNLFFGETRFSNRASFVDAEFGNKAQFLSIKFADRCDFRSARFTGETLFRNYFYKDRASGKIMNFTNVIFEQPSKVRIQNMDLQSFAFVNTDVREIDFLDCTWPTIGKRVAVFDEVFEGEPVESVLPKATLGEVEELYRRLQLNFEGTKRYAEAGDFYIGSMEMRRRQIAAESNRPWRWVRQNLLSLESWYRNISLYGQRWKRTLVWMALVINVFPLCYLLSGFQYAKDVHVETHFYTVNHDLGGTLNYSQFVKDYARALNISFLTFTFQRDVPYRHSDASRALAVAESALSATLIALFLLAIRRRFRR